MLEHVYPGLRGGIDSIENDVVDTVEVKISMAILQEVLVLIDHFNEGRHGITEGRGTGLRPFTCTPHV